MTEIKRKGQRRKLSSTAVTSVLETLLLLSMTIGFFAILYVSVFSFSFSAVPPAVRILGTTADDTILLYHRGGESLTINSTILLTIDGSQTDLVLGDYLDETAKEDSRWSMGEQLIITGFDLGDQQGEIMIIDGDTNVLVFRGYL